MKTELEKLKNSVTIFSTANHFRISSFVFVPSLTPGPPRSHFLSKPFINHPKKHSIR